MDWTGGTRRRFAASKNNAVVQKQKAHFAKARAAQQNSRSSQHSFKRDFLQSTSYPAASVGRYERAHDRQRREASQSEGRLRSRSGRSHGIRPISEHDANNLDEGHRRGSKRPATERYSPSVISISSRDESSSPASVTSRHGTKKAHSKVQDSASHGNNINEEEQLLLAKRRKLLARSDWLGLNMRRPVTMKFQYSGDKDRIGKRRKLRSSASRKGKPAAPRMMTPLFHPRPSPGDRTVSGPLERDDIRIKIGTDALASHTQPSRQSHTPGRTSARHPSTEFGPLSEESMLLGPDEEAFQAELLQGHAVDNMPAHIPDNRSTMVVAGSQMTQAPHITPEIAEMRHLHKAPEYYMQHEPNQDESHGAGAIEPFEVVPEQDYGMGTQLWTRQLENREEPDDEDDMWRKILEISQAASSHHSIAALKSSSMHVDTSESDQRPNKVDRSQQNAIAITPALVIPHRPIDQPAVDNTRAVEVQETLKSDTAVLQSPSASLKQITKLAEQPAIQSRQAQEDARDEALWKQFVVGSQDSSDDVPQLRDIAAVDDDLEDIEPVQSSSALAVSGLGTSVKSTIGDTLFVTTDTSSRVSEQMPKRKRKRKSERGLNNDTLVIDTASPHRILQTVAAEEEDDIEDVELPPRRSGRANIHGGTTNILNHKRFKPPVKKAAAVERKPSRFCASRRSKTFAEGARSVYDLVDSDGMSLA